MKWKGMKCFITGGDGFIGKYLVKSLINDGAIVEFSKFRETSTLENGIYWDITKPYFSNKKYDFVFHLAALTSLIICNKNPELANEVNVIGTKNAINFSKSADAKFIYLSTCGVYGNYIYIPMDENHPTNPTEEYSKSKLKGEKIVETVCSKLNIESIIVRIFSVYGPMESPNRIISKLIIQSIQNKEVHLESSLNVTRDFIFIDDVISGIKNISMLENSDKYNLGTGIETKLNDVITVISNIIGEKINILTKSNNLFSSPNRSCANISKIINELNLRPEISIEAGIKKMIKLFF